jgi:hypothetical protein
MVARATPCTALANDPPIRYGTPNVSSASITSNVTATGSGNIGSLLHFLWAVYLGGQVGTEQ